MNRIKKRLTHYKRAAVALAASSVLATTAAVFSPGDLGGAWLPEDPQETILRRVNQFTYSEFPNGVTDAPTRSGLLSATTMTNYSGALAFGYDGATSTIAYKNFTPVLGITYVLSVVVEMTDGLIPVFGSATPANAANDFIIVMDDGAVVPSNYNIVNLGNSQYRVWVARTFTDGAGVGFGLIKYNTNSNRTFKATAYQLEINTAFNFYQKVTDWTTEFLAAGGSNIVLFTDSTGSIPCVKLEDTVGLCLDARTRGQRGPEIAPALEAVNWSVAGEDGTHIVTWIGGGFRYQSDTTTPTLSITKTLLLTIGKHYEVIVNTSAGVSGGLKSASFKDDPTISSGTSPGRITIRGRAISTSLQFTRISVNVDVTVNSISIREIPGVHWDQTSTPSKPVLSARVNQILKTEQLDDATWSKTNGGVASIPTISATKVDAPDGTLTAQRITFALNGGTTSTDISQLLANAVTYLGTESLKNTFWARTSDGSTKTVTSVLPDGSAIQTIITGSWKEFAQFRTAAAGLISTLRIRLRGNEATSDAATIDLWHPDTRYSSDINQPPYQSVNTVSDYNSTGFSSFFRTDGTDDSGLTSAVDLTAYDGVQLIMAVTKESDAAAAIIIEFSANAGANNGTFYITGPLSVDASFGFLVRGTADNTLRALGNASPITALLNDTAKTAAADVSDALKLQINKKIIAAASVTTNVSTGNLGNHVFYLFRRNNASLPFKGRCYGIFWKAGGFSISQEKMIQDFLQRRAKLII